MTTTFWLNDPLILFNKDYILQLWPSSDMTYEEKLNAITRVVIIMTILGYIFTMSFNMIVAGLVTLFAIILLYKMKKQKVTKDMLNGSKEGFS
jgi:hypothetical protein